MGRLAAALITGLMAVGAAGCGDDEDKASKTTPTISVQTAPPNRTQATPGATAPSTQSTPTQAPTNTAPPSDPSGGTKAPAAPQRPTPQAPKAKPGEDPADAFDRYCKEHPGTCG